MEDAKWLLMDSGFLFCFVLFLINFLFYSSFKFRDIEQKAQRFPTHILPAHVQEPPP